MQQRETSWWQAISGGRIRGSSRFAIFTILASTLAAFLLCARIDVKIGDWLLTSWGGPTVAQTDIVVVSIDEQSLATLPYRSPIDRKFLAELIGHIGKGNPRAIGIDILFDQPSEKAKDLELLKTLRSAEAPIILAYASEADGLTARQTQFINSMLRQLQAGHVSLSRDAFDGIVRHWPHPLNQPTRSLLFARAIANAGGSTSSAPAGRITFYRNEAGTPFNFATYPAHAAKLLPYQWFQNKIVLIGATLPNIDQHQTPFTTTAGIEVGAIYGVKIHAHMIAQLLHGDSISQMEIVPKMLFSLLLASLIALIFGAVSSLPRRLTIIGTIMGSLTALTLALYSSLAIELPVATLLVAVLLASAAFIIRDWHTDWSERRFIQQAFAQYVSPALVEKIAANHDTLKLGGEQRAVTYIFTDLEGFTSLSESLPPERISEILNAYLDGMCDLFISHGATIDKIIGDAVVGLYGAPEEQPNHANQAVQLALAIDAFAEAFRTSDIIQDTQLGATRVGLHAGPAVVGNFGGRRFFDYTAIGDTVNTAARLEGANKHFGTRICVSRDVAHHAQKHTYRPIGDVILKGKEEAVTCYEPIHPSDEKSHYLGQYREAFELLDNNPQEAAAIFHSLSQQYRGDGLTSFHLSRIEAGQRGVRIHLDNK